MKIKNNKINKKMNTELEKLILELAEGQDAINKKLKSLDKKINNLSESNEKHSTDISINDLDIDHLNRQYNNLEKSKDLLFTITDNHSDSICENIENIEILNEKITAIEENLIENIKIFNSNDKKYNENIAEFNDYKERLKFLYNSNKERINDIDLLKEKIEDLQERNTIEVKEDDIVYFTVYGDTTKFKIVSIIGDKVILKFCTWWLPRLLGNDRYINVPKDAIYYKDKKNYIIK